MSITENDFLRLSRRIKAIEDLPQSAGEISLSEVGAITLWPMNKPPESWLICDGSEVSRTEYAALFGKLCVCKGNAAISIDSPAVITLPGHGLSEGDKVFLKTSGALPSGLYSDMQYYVKLQDADTFNLSLTPGGTAADTAGSQAGIHTVFACPWGINGAATFNLPNLKGKVPVGRDNETYEFDSLGKAGGEAEHTLTVEEMPSHSHIQDAHTHIQNSHLHDNGSLSVNIARSGSHDHTYYGGSGLYINHASGTSSSKVSTGNSYNVLGDGSHTHSASVGGTTASTTVTNQNTAATNQSAGGGGAHNNMQPYVVLNFIVRYQSYILPKKGDKGDKGEKGDRGDMAPQIVIEYSADAQYWHSGYAENDDYIRFSADGANTWGGAVNIRGRRGEQGIQGVKGEKGICYCMRGEYDSSAMYVNNSEYIDCVTYRGSSYYAKQYSEGNLPIDAAYWGILALKGMDGTGTGDVIAPAMNTADKLPQWNGDDTKTLKDGVTIADIVAAAKQAVYPVGSLYYNANDGTNPAALLGFGTWEAFGAGRVPVGFSPGDVDFGTIGAAPGEKAHTLTESETPVHTHIQNQHSHGPGTLSGYYKMRDNDDAGSAVRGGEAFAYSAYDMNGSAGSVVINAGTTADATPVNQNAGGGGAHNNIQPSIVVYIWKRTA